MNLDKQTPPPRWAQRLLEWFCPTETLEEVQGDLAELHAYWIETIGKRAADRRYAWSALRLMRPFAKRKKSIYSSPSFLQPFMLRNYFIIAWRTLKKQKISTSINVAGLSIGLASCLLIMIYLHYELSYDRFHQKADQIVRVAIHLKINGFEGATTLGPSVAGDLRHELPDIRQYTRIRNQGSKFVSYQAASFKEENILFADATFFEVFTIPFLKGNPKTALQEPYTVVLTEETAMKYFGEEDPMGKVLSFGSEKTPYRVSGVVSKMPANSHFRFDLLASLTASKEAQETGWFNNMNFYTYLLLPPGYDYKLLEPKIQRLGEKYIGSDVQKFFGTSLHQFRQKGSNFRLSLQPLTDIHLHSPLGGGELSSPGNMWYIYVLIAIGLFVLLLACVNFINLSTATAAGRAREVGIRKVLGSLKGQLQQQFLMESLLLSLVALVIGVLLAGLTLPTFNHLTGKNLSLTLLTELPIAIGLIVTTGLIGLLAGSYPAFYLASFNPLLVLKGQNLTAYKGLHLRNGLVVFQFFISISLLIATMIAYQQLHYMQGKNVGYDPHQVLVIHDSYMLGNKETLFWKKLQQYPHIRQASISGNVPVGSTSVNNSAVMPKEDPQKMVASRLYNIDYTYIPTLGMQLIEGRNFSNTFSTDSAAVILNETALHAFGWQDNPIGKELIRQVGNQGSRKIYRVIGVVSDFHFETLRQKVTPLVMFLGDNSGSILVKINTKNLAQTLTSLKREWESFAPAAPFSYSFLDDRFEQAYHSEQKTGQALSLFSGLTIIVACLGLYGLATYTAGQRRKEIGVRKVLGASLPDILLLLSKEFMRLVLIAFLLAVPVAWYVMHRWLEEFAYRIEVEGWIFMMAGAVAMVIALLTVGYQAIKAALMNPVKTLRNE